MHVDYPDTPVAFLSTRSTGVFKSLNGGQDWISAGDITRELTHQADVHYVEVAISPDYDSDREVYLATFEGFWKSIDSGESWIYADILPNRLIRDIKVSPSYGSDRTVMMSTYGSGVVRSLDAGESFDEDFINMTKADLFVMSSRAMAMTIGYLSKGIKIYLPNYVCRMLPPDQYVKTDATGAFDISRMKSLIESKDEFQKGIEKL